MKVNINLSRPKNAIFDELAEKHGIRVYAEGIDGKKYFSDSEKKLHAIYFALRDYIDIIKKGSTTCVMMNYKEVGGKKIWEHYPGYTEIESFIFNQTRSLTENDPHDMSLILSRLAKLNVKVDVSRSDDDMKRDTREKLERSIATLQAALANH